MAIVKSLFGEYFDCTLNMDIAHAEIVGFSVSQEKMSARLTIKPYRKIEEDRLKALERLSELSCDDRDNGALSFYEAIERSAVKQTESEAVG